MLILFIHTSLIHASSKINSIKRPDLFVVTLPSRLRVLITNPSLDGVNKIAPKKLFEIGNCLQDNILKEFLSYLINIITGVYEGIPLLWNPKSI